jgi:tetratricopeptide (TPR) repeat protein
VKRLITGALLVVLALSLGYGVYSELERRGRARVSSIMDLSVPGVTAQSWLSPPPGFTEEQTRDMGALNAAIDRDPAEPRFYIWRSMLHERAAAHAAALQDINMAVGLDVSQRAYFLYMRHRQLDKLGRSSEALADVLEAIRLAKPGAEYHRAAADLYSRRGDVDAGVAVFDDALRTRPDNLFILTEKAKFLSTVGRHDLAISEMTKAIDRETVEFDRWLRSAGRLSMSIDAKRFEDGLAYADRHIDEYPDDNLGYSYRSKIHQAMGNHRKAEKDEARSHELRGY